MNNFKVQYKNSLSNPDSLYYKRYNGILTKLVTSKSKEDIYKLLPAPNWTIERLRQSHCFMYNVEEYKKGNYVLEPWFAAMSEEMRDAVNEYLGWHMMVKASKL